MGVDSLRGNISQMEQGAQTIPSLPISLLSSCLWPKNQHVMFQPLSLFSNERRNPWLTTGVQFIFTVGEKMNVQKLHVEMQGFHVEMQHAKELRLMSKVASDRRKKAKKNNNKIKNNTFDNLTPGCSHPHPLNTKINSILE